MEAGENLFSFFFLELFKVRLTSFRVRDHVATATGIRIVGPFASVGYCSVCRINAILLPVPS